MKAILICPDKRTEVAALAEAAPLASLPMLGKSLVEYWVEHLATFGATEILVLAADRPNQIRAAVGNGARWGVRVIVQLDQHALTPAEARERHQAMDDAPWLQAPNNAVLMDHLPDQPQLPLFTSYANWFAAAQALILATQTPDRIGLHELKPGTWTGLNAHVAPGVRLVAPCWIGAGAWIEAGAVIGPHAVLEREVFVARGAEVSHSIIGPETLVGQFTEIRHSIACGSTLVNWQRDSCVKVPDAFLLCSRESQRASPIPANSPTPVHAPQSATARALNYITQLLT